MPESSASSVPMVSSAKSNYLCRSDPLTLIEPSAGSLAGARVLVVDDEFLIAAQLQCDLTEAGAEVIGPSHTLQAALALAEREHLTAAILDIQLGRDSVGPGRAAPYRSGDFVRFLHRTGAYRPDPRAMAEFQGHLPTGHCRQFDRRDRIGCEGKTQRAGVMA